MYPPLIQLLLQPRNLLQALRIAYQLLHALLLLLRQLHPIRLIARRSAIRGCSAASGGDIEGVGFDAHDLRGRLRISLPSGYGC